MVNERYALWCEKAVADKDVADELKNMKNDNEAISEAFYKDLEFGTGGLRGIIGAGTNRMNIYTVGKASQGLAAYVNSVTEKGSIAVAYDSRIKSDVFARTAASIPNWQPSAPYALYPLYFAGLWLAVITMPASHLKCLTA